MPGVVNGGNALSGGLPTKPVRRFEKQNPRIGIIARRLKGHGLGTERTAIDDDIERKRIHRDSGKVHQKRKGQEKTAHGREKSVHKNKFPKRIDIFVNNT